jgi:glutaminyl-peptide cyclotransferase
MFDRTPDKRQINSYANRCSSKPALFLLILLFSSVSCTSQESGLKFSEQGRDVPEFSSDRAYQYVEEQLAFGPRVPGTDAHFAAKEYFTDHFKRKAGNRAVFVQSFEQEVYGERLPFYNVLASFGTEKTDRILLAAHWDTRPRGEKDPDAS